MRTVTTVNIIWEDGDKELIFTKIPKNPCDTCSLGIACCGCPDGRKYLEAIKPLKEHGVLELAVKANEYYKIEQEIKKLNAKKRELKAEFAELGLDVSKIFDVMEA